MYPSQQTAAELVAELCKLFYDQGWVSGTGGGISIRASDDALVMAPSGVQKERMRPEDMFTLNLKGEIMQTPESRPPPYKPPKLSECSPLFMLAYEHRDAGAVLHSHSMNAVLATLLDPGASEFKCTHLEMMKGISGTGFYDTMVVPIVENTARECELTERMRAAMLAHPRASAVLVRRHGVYVWGKTWIEAKTQAECYDYLFGIAVRMAGMGIDPTRPPPRAPLAALPTATAQGTNGENGARPAKMARTMPAALPSFVVLDIEGTVAPISFVAGTLFPYAKEHAERHLMDTYDTAETQSDIALLRAQAVADVAEGVQGAETIPEDPQAAVVRSCMRNVAAQMAADRKTLALKTLQGHVWHAGFQSGALRCELFRDVPDALQQWRDRGLKTYVYSSGSRQAQRDLFGHTTVGDLRPYLMGFFDTTSGSKAEPCSYREIQQSIGAEDPGEILFATDAIKEAVAAQSAGWRAVLVERPGNSELPDKPGFRVIRSMDELLQ